jgi:signal transduction histidine kinase
MKTEGLTFPEHYQQELQSMLVVEGLSVLPERRLKTLVQEAHASGLKLKTITRLHDSILAGGIMPGCPPGKQKDWLHRAGAFLASMITQYSDSLPGGSQARTITALRRRNGVLSREKKELQSTVNRMQSRERVRIKQEQQAARKRPAVDFQKIQLRNLSRKILLSQEKERKRISRELHDEIAQALIAVYVHLAALKKEAHLNTNSLTQNIGNTQRLVSRSAKIIHQFARELRPAALDDLGLVPALESFVDQFHRRTGIAVELQVPLGLETLDCHRRTAIFRVVQESLTNVDRHADASRVVIHLSRADDLVTLLIHDNGRSFRVGSPYRNHGTTKRLGLLGMRERIEMVGGAFEVKSAPTSGTTVSAVIPMNRTPLLHMN